MRSDPTLIGTVQDVAGTTISVSLVRESVTGLSFFKGESYRIGQVGSFIRIPLGYTSLFGAVKPATLPSGRWRHSRPGWPEDQAL